MYAQADGCLVTVSVWTGVWDSQEKELERKYFDGGDKGI